MTASRRRAPLDTVQAAEASPDRSQPYAELGLARDEYARIKEILGRRPTSSELAMYSVMWSEHCSYKSSKVHLKQFAEKIPEGARSALLVGMGENAGVVDVGGGLAVTFKIESHNHPSYVEPYQGAATGVGGIVRDILTMGARPIAVLDSLRFGAAEAPDTARVLPGVVSGIGGYGNCLGLPNIGGELVFDPSYLANPLVNALCVGVLPADGIKLAKAEGPGSLVVLFGARTGGDGIGGASVLASASFEREGERKRPAVQVGDPFAEKVLIECCLEIFAADLVTGIQDLGAAGLSCATTELAAAGSGGMSIDLDLVPLRDETLAPEEILMSESQERMMAVVTPDNLEAFLAICARWEVTATVLGTVTDGDRLVMRWHGETIVDVPPGTLANEGPVYRRPVRRPYDQDALNGEHGNGLPRPKSGEQLRNTALKLISSANLADKSWVTDQYDRYVQGNTVLAQPENAGVVRLPGPDGTDSNVGIAVSVDGNGRYCRLDPYAGAQLALAEAYRNVAVTGARPLAVTNCLNFGSPEDPAVMWQFAEAVRGLADGCQQLGIPVTGGNVSFYNQTGTTAILPTPVVGVLGVIDDVTRCTPMACYTDGALLYLLGDTRDEFGGSEWAHVIHGFLGGKPPKVDLERERLIADVLINAARDGLIDAAHDLSDGGLFVALAEMCLRGASGIRIVVPEGVDPFVFLFSESAGRAIVAVPRTEEVRFTDMCTARKLPAQRIGVLDVLEAAVEVQGQFRIPMAELRVAWAATLPKLFG
ncbi:phosphoribosylformylglycinamidine synthase subunit PurL [Jatrophihabitans sp.]|uniref:phosphoribosylformylglycinamidine synthase subunit PurL n=1 Tax=Jatrophihabitans sp. TaxID=1932789 RepID=UPI002CF1F2BE|nr:phosphoribosylformylglycinamidine synthase subunit PurL [Jatrophihabitans sp.]